MKRKTISTEHGTAVAFKRGKYWNYSITLDDISLPKKDRRIRKSLGVKSPDNLVEKIRNDVKREYKNILKGITCETLPIPFIRKQYIPHITKLTERSYPTDNLRGTWNKRKLKYDTAIIENYLIPFIEQNRLQFSDFKPKAMERLHDYFVEQGFSISTIQKRRGVFNSICRYAIKHELMDYLPIHPLLPKPLKKHKQRLNSYAFPDTEMVKCLRIEAGEELEKDFRGKNKKSIWNRQIALWWLDILIDTGIRPFPKIPFYFSDINYEKEGHISFWRKEKTMEYRAQGGEIATNAINNLRLMYKKVGIEPIHILSRMDGTQATKTNYYLRKILKQADWTVDKDGRRYAPHSIRKWHITTAVRNGGETTEQIAERVGHSVDTLREYYLEPLETGITRPKGLMRVLNVEKKIIQISRS